MVALWLLAALLLAVALRAPLGLAMIATGALGYAHFSSAEALAAHLATAWPARFMSHDLAMVPLFVLMGHLATRGGLSAALFAACRAWIGHWRGGLAMAAVAGCALFGAISGSSVATASTTEACIAAACGSQNRAGSVHERAEQEALCWPGHDDVHTE